MTRKIIIMNSIITAIIILIFLSLSVVIVDETQYAIILRFGEIRKIISNAGLFFKTPFVDNVVKFEKRYSIYDIPSERIITKDKKTLVVDSYIIWRIYDPKLFLESMKTEILALSRVDDVVYSGLRNTLAKFDMDSIVVQEKLFLSDVAEFTRNNLREFGIEVLDVRIKRTDLPSENRNAVFERMKSERQSIAALIRAEGEKEAQRIRAEADKKAAIIKAEALSKAEYIKGTGDASAAKIYAESYSKNDEFYRLWKTLETYKDIIPKSTIILNKNMEILQYLK